jgi:cyclopropane fatty-acyl-phospholipid synthase-like methyltransferase
MTSLWLTLYRWTRLPRSTWQLNEDTLNQEFQTSWADNKKIWERFGAVPDFRGKKVLDLGSGTGAMVFHIAERGAARIVGLDIDTPYIDYARRKLSQDFAVYQDKIEFREHYLHELEEKDFDFIVSKDSFEHILHLDEHLKLLHGMLKPGGKIYTAFAPLWRSARGDHYRTRTRLPWGHLIFPEHVLLQGMRELHPERTANSIEDLGLNKLSLRDFKTYVLQAGLKFDSLRINVGANPALRLYNIGRMIPGLGEYFTHNVYAVMERA